MRPEFVSLSDEPFAEGSCAGEMVRVENMGHEFFVYLKVADYELTARVPSDDAEADDCQGTESQSLFHL
ncbi:TOBE domain-containing protein [Klebsiella pneumoniae]|nr:TOBE domain-containing protein [Klebsiella pneumoniae]